jgi:acetyl esterase/lipase
MALPRSLPTATRPLVAAAIAMLIAAHAVAAGRVRDALADRGRASVPTPGLPAGTRVVRDVGYGADPRQRFDVYRPAGARGAPIVVMAHGGGWAFGDKASPGVVGDKAAHWLARGAVFVSLNYRLLPQAPPRVQAGDLALALAAVQRRAVEFGGDPARVVLMGHSAGAHLAALVHADRALSAAGGARPWLGTVLLDGAALDVPALMAGRPMRLHTDAFGGDPREWNAASPLHALSGPTAPLLAVCASGRREACPQAEAFVRRANALGGRAEVLAVPLSHLQINRDLGAPGPYTRSVDRFLQTLDPRFGQAATPSNTRSTSSPSSASAGPAP